MTDAMVTPIHARGRFFWKGDTRFLVKGVVYRLHGEGATDPLSDDRLQDLERDITLFKELRLNVLFVDLIDTSCGHDMAMRLLADAGIYVLVSLPTAASTTDTAGTTTTFRPYNQRLLEDCFATVDCMSQYSNTLGLVVANGALSTIYSTSAAPMIKTVIRDVKRYMSTAQSSVGQRPLPLGYSACNSRVILKTTFDYFSAGDKDQTVDFFCYANFNWCGQSTMHMSGYDDELRTFANTNIPVFFSQYGCNLGTCGRRIFQETSAIYSSAMMSVFSGGIAYEFYDSPDIRSSHWGYGLVRTEDAVVGKGLTKLPDFDSLKSRLEACERVSPTPPMSLLQSGMETRRKDDVDAHFTETPPLSRHWRAGHALPYTLADWNGVRRSLEDKAWVDVRAEEVENIGLSLRRNVIRA